jgi:hypothetical protein
MVLGIGDPQLPVDPRQSLRLVKLGDVEPTITLSRQAGADAIELLTPET